MYLLNVETLKLENFNGLKPPKYAILSHVWEEEEVLFNDIQQSTEYITRLKGFSKIKGACNQAKADGFRYIWIDTCCIDKSSSAELSEAINSMFAWYRRSSVCYAYLTDVNILKRKNVPITDTMATKDSADSKDRTPMKGYGYCKIIIGRFQITPDPDLSEIDFQLTTSRWFTRGWTLQELIAPPDVRLYDEGWRFLGNRHSLTKRISSITGIHENILTLNHGNSGHTPYTPLSLDGVQIHRCQICGVKATIESILQTHSVATRMSWAASRETTRPEDEAYCLMGIFNINMPLLYGEGRNAFARLQREIIATLNDQSILAHTAPTALRFSFLGIEAVDFLAAAPAHYRCKVGAGEMSSAITWDGRALSVEILLCPCDLRVETWRGKTMMGILDCHSMSNDLSRFAIFLSRVRDKPETYRRFTDFLVELKPNVQSPLRCDHPMHGPPLPPNYFRDYYVWAQPGDFEKACSKKFENAVAHVFFDLASVERRRICLHMDKANSLVPSMPYCAIRTIAQPATDNWSITGSFPRCEVSNQDDIDKYLPRIGKFPELELDLSYSYIYDLGIGALFSLGQGGPKSDAKVLIALGHTKALNRNVPWCRISGFTRPLRISDLEILYRTKTAFEATSLGDRLCELNETLKCQQLKPLDLIDLKKSQCLIDGRVVEVAVEEHSFLGRSRLELSITIRTDGVE